VLSDQLALMRACCWRLCAVYMFDAGGACKVLLGWCCLYIKTMRFDV
jgi:hypothetical protein